MFIYLISLSIRSLKVFKKVLYWHVYSFFIIMRKIEIDNVEEMIEKTVTSDGKIGGLKKHAGKNVLIVVTKGKS